MKHRILVFSAAAIAASASLLTAAEDENQAVQKTLARLQGKWETNTGNMRSLQTIAGNSSTVDRFDADGNLVHRHQAKFNLKVTDNVTIFTFFDLEVTAGARKGLKFKGPLSMIIVVRGDSWVEARGLLNGETDGEPRLQVWKRVVEKTAAR